MKTIHQARSLFPQKKAIWVAACVLATGLLGASSPALADKKSDTLRMAYDQAPESVDPYFNNVRIGVIIAANVWDTLLYRDPMT
ncbi:MAG TPA: ABC transporter substrate-binding protein, partial [Candidimonas sp.]|nr:ABC transporter substrate-binding protein [Candidimonas sp.]